MIELVEGVFVSLWLAADDDERGIDMIDGHDIPIHESILEKGPYVLVLFVLLQHAAPPREQSLTHLS
jgi:hypothetical protein